MRALFVTRLLWSWPVAVALALFGILATGVAVRARSTEGRLRIEALAVPETQPERLPEERAPLHRQVGGDDLGAAAAYLLSDGAAGVTATTLYVDAGYHSMGM